MCFLSIYAYTYRLALPSVLDREGSSCSGQRLMQRLITSVSVENEWLLNVHPEIGPVHRSPPPSKAQEHPEEEEMNIRAKGWGGALWTAACSRFTAAMTTWENKSATSATFRQATVTGLRRVQWKKRERRDGDIKRGLSVEPERSGVGEWRQGSEQDALSASMKLSKNKRSSIKNYSFFLPFVLAYQIICV